MKKVSIQMTSGRGPAECCWVVAKVLKLLLKEALEAGLSYQILHREPGEENGTLKTASITFEGQDVESLSHVGKVLYNGLGKVLFANFISGKTGLLASTG